MGTKARPSQLRPHPAIRAWQAREARRTARAAAGPGAAGQRYAWPADRQAILEQTLAAAWPGPSSAGDGLGGKAHVSSDAGTRPLGLSCDYRLPVQPGVSPGSAARGIRLVPCGEPDDDPGRDQGVPEA